MGMSAGSAGRKAAITREVKDGGDGEDFYFGTKGNDTYHGMGGDDDIYGNGKDDKLYGDDGSDYIVGEYGNDKLYGGKDDDLLDGREGKDILNGGPGVDVFMFWDMYGRDVIVDFKPGTDMIDLEGLSEVTSFRDLKRNHMTDAGKDVIIDGGDGLRLTVKNIDIKDFEKDDFDFQDFQM